MDEHYDYARAKLTVQCFSEESLKTNARNLSGILKAGTTMAGVSLQQDTDEFVWRLVRKHDDDELEEIVFSCIGVICNADLPPVVRMPIMSRDKSVTIAQAITVTGIGCQSFDDAIATLQEIKLIADREFKSGTLEKWTAATYQGFPAFNLSNRYFRNAKDGTQHEVIEFSKDVDPVGILQRLGKSNVVHTEDNEVQYFKSHVDEEGKRRYQRARPQLFRVGDVVEVQCSVIFVKAKGTKHRMKLVLRSIALLDCEITLDAKRKMTNVPTQEEPSVKRLKRKVGYEDDEEEKEKKRAHMDESSG